MKLKTGIIMLLVGIAIIGMTASTGSAWGAISHNAIAKSATAPYPASSYTSTYQNCATGPDIYYVPGGTDPNVGAKLHTDTFGHKIFALSTNNDKKACALGFITHIAGDPYMHNSQDSWGKGYLKWKYGYDVGATWREVAAEAGIDSLTYWEKNGRAKVAVDSRLVADAYNAVRDAGQPAITWWSVSWRAQAFAELVKKEQEIAMLPGTYATAKASYGDYSNHYTKAYNAATAAMKTPTTFTAIRNY